MAAKDSRGGSPGAQRAINLPAEPGDYYEAEVPDTLDLAYRAQLGLHHFTETIDQRPEYGCEMAFASNLFTHCPPGMGFHIANLGCCQPKALEAMAFLRLMSGSRENLDREAAMMEMMASCLGEDGLFWTPSSPETPWRRILEPFVYLHGQGRMLRAMIAWLQYTGDDAWKGRLDRMVDGLDKLAVHKGDYAYFPVRGPYKEDYLGSCYTRGGKNDLSEPENEKLGEEGSLFCQQGHFPGALANWYLLSGNEQALRLSGELVRFFTKPKFWADFGTEYPEVFGAQHAHWMGHFHGHMNTLRAILEYAIATNDSRLKLFVREGYEWARQPWLARIGYVGDGQGCGCGRLTGLAVKLSEVGVGDYWEDVDLYIRNQGTAMQYTPEDLGFIHELCKGKPPISSAPDYHITHLTDKNVIDSSIGAFAMGPSKGGWCICCATHGNMGLFYAWAGALRHSDGTVRVNLLLNRASPWVDVDSYLPYEGKVVLRNKTAREAFMRIPLWADKGRVRLRVGRTSKPPRWFGNYLHLPGLEAGAVVTVEFPMVERTEEWKTLDHVRSGDALQPGWKEDLARTIKFRGNTVVELSEPLMPGSSTMPCSPLYVNRPAQYQSPKAPTKAVTRYVTPRVLKW